MNYKNEARKILYCIGEEGNIESVSHCVTRLRFNLKDMNKVKQDKIKEVSGVLGVNQSGGQFQVIIGKEASNYFDSLLEVMRTNEEKKDNHVQSKQEKKKKSLFEILSSIFTPVIPAIAGAGIIKAILVVLASFGWISSENQIVNIFSSIYDVSLYFLPIILSFSTALALGSNPYVAGIIPLLFLQPSLLPLMGIENTSLHNLNHFSNPTTYSSTLFSSIFTAWVASYVEKFFNRKIPSSLHLILVPALTLVVVVPLTFLILNPLGILLGDWLSLGFNYIHENLGILSGALFGAAWTFFIMSGMHYILIPILLNNLINLGFDYLYVAAFMMNMGHAGAALSVYLSTKDSEMKSLSLSSSISALIGITEPALFGVNMKIKQAFIAAVLGGSIGGACSSLFDVKFHFLSLVAGIPGITALVGPAFAYALFSMSISFIVALLIGCLLFRLKN